MLTSTPFLLDERAVLGQLRAVVPTESHGLLPQLIRHLRPTLTAQERVELPPSRLDRVDIREPVAGWLTQAGLLAWAQAAMPQRRDALARRMLTYWEASPVSFRDTTIPTYLYWHQWPTWVAGPHEVWRRAIEMLRDEPETRTRVWVGYEANLRAQFLSTDLLPWEQAEVSRHLSQLPIGSSGYEEACQQIRRGGDAYGVQGVTSVTADIVPLLRALGIQRQAYVAYACRWEKALRQFMPNTAASIARRLAREHAWIEQHGGE